MVLAFWRFAYRRYHARPPSFLGEFALLTWGGFFLIVYGAALFAGWRPAGLASALGILVTIALLLVGLARHRIRREAAKAPDALYRKYLVTSARRLPRR